VIRHCRFGISCRTASAGPRTAQANLFVHGTGTKILRADSISALIAVIACFT
jgi:hypothetical protein